MSRRGRLIRRLRHASWFALTMIATDAAAQDSYLWLNGDSSVRITPETGGPVARVTFHNTMVHRTLIEAFTVETDGIAVLVEAHVGHGQDPDTIIVTPPDGFIAIPPSITVEEGGVDSLLIWPADIVPLG